MKTKTTAQKINRIFYIYSEASAGVLFAAGAIVEAACFFVVPEFFQPLAAGAALALAAAAAACVKKIYTEEKNG